MSLRLTLVAVVLAVAAAVPAVAETQEDASSLPPLLIRWPLAPRARAATPPPVVRPPSRPLEPVLEPVKPPERDPRLPEELEGRLPGTLPPAREPKPPASLEPGTLEPVASAPIEAEPVDPAEALERLPVGSKQPGGKTDVGETDLSFDLLGPFVPPPRLSLALGSFEVQPPSAELRRWTFPAQEGLSWSSLESERDGDWVILRGAVDVQADQDRIQADEVRLNEKTKQLIAEGNVVLDHLDSRLAGERMDFDLTTNTGTVWNAIGYARGDITFTGERVEKIGPNKYVVYAGSFTSCTQPLPIWQVKVSKAIVDVDNFVYLFNPRVAFKRLPASWFPWAAIPIKQERATGFMVPKVSSSSVRGFSVSEDFFWAINRSVDSTVGGQWWAKFGWSANVTGRWHLDGMPSPGRFEMIYLDAKDPEEVNGRVLDATRWYASIEHQQDLWENWKLTVKGELGSDRLTQQQPFFDVEGNLGSPTPVFNQRLTLQRRWGKHSLSINVENDERETESSAPSPFESGSIRTSTTETRRLPEAEYRLSSVQIGGRKWAAFQMEAAAGFFQAARPLEFDGTIGGTPESGKGFEYDHDWFTADVYPQLRFPLGNAFFEIVPSVNLRATWWSQQQAEDTAPVDVISPDVTVTNRATIEESLFLWAWDAGVSLGGPDFQRIFRRAAGPGERKWQHLIEPSIDVTYTPRIDEDFPISQDRRSRHYTGRMERTGARASVGLVNTLRTKTVPALGETGDAARDWLIWRLSADYNFREKSRTSTFIVDPDQDPDLTREERSHWGDIRSDINFRPSENIRFSVRNTYDILQDDVTSTSLTGGVEGNWGYVDMAFTSRRQNTTLEDQNTEMTLTGENWFYKNERIRIGYDFTKSFNGSIPASGSQRARSSWPYKRLAVSYFNQCCGVSLSWEDVDDRSVEREKEWTFIVTLKDVGNWLRLRQRSSN